MKKIFIGIDPGKTGAIATIASNGFVEILDYEDPLLIDYMHSISRSKGVAVIEKVGAMPRQGVVSTFKFGTNYGVWQGILKTLRIPFVFCTPTKWQKEVYESTQKEYKTTNKPVFDVIDGQMQKVGTAKIQRVDTKNMSLNVARQLFPTVASKYLTRKKDHNRAEALLIAEFCRRKFK